MCCKYFSQSSPPLFKVYLFLFFSFLLHLLEWHWLTKLYKFQVHNSPTRHLYTVVCVHHSNSLSPVISLYPSSLPPPSPPNNHHTFVQFCEFFSFFFLIPPPSNHPIPCCQPSLYLWVIFYFIAFALGSENFYHAKLWKYSDFFSLS